MGEHVALELSTRLGRPVSFGRTVEAGEPGVCDVITECPQDEAVDSDLPRLLLQAAVDVVQRVLDGAAPDCDAYLSALRDEHERALPGPSAAGIGAAARARGRLDRQGYLPTSVPPAGETVWLRDNANLSTGGNAVDVTEQLHPDIADVCQRAAALVGLDIAGVDLRMPDVTAPLPATHRPSPNGGVIEVNAVPGLRMHLEPSVGTARDVGRAIVDALYPYDDGRIPTVAVTGTNGKTSTVRLIAHLLGEHGLRVGLTTTDGVYIGGRLVRHGDNTGPRSAQLVLGDPTVQAAVLETARGGIMREGLGYDWTDVGVITNVAADHLGQDGLRTVEDILGVKALVAERVRDGGTLILNADDPLLRTLVEQPLTRAAHKRIVWFTRSPSSELIARHLTGGGLAYLLKEGWLIETDGGREDRLLRVTDLPGGYGGAAGHAADNALAAAAAARALGVSSTLLTERLKSFQPHHHNPGRGMLFRHEKASFLVDYAHNPAAIRAVIDTLCQLRPPHRTLAVVTLPGDRTDELLIESPGTIASGFDRIVLYEDADLRGRAPGEVRELVRRKIEHTRPDVRCTSAKTVAEAVSTALDLAEQDDLILVLYEKADDVLAALRSTPSTRSPSLLKPWFVDRLRHLRCGAWSTCVRPNSNPPRLASAAQLAATAGVRATSW